VTWWSHSSLFMFTSTEISVSPFLYSCSAIVNCQAHCFFFHVQLMWVCVTVVPHLCFLFVNWQSHRFFDYVLWLWTDSHAVLHSPVALMRPVGIIRLQVHLLRTVVSLSLVMFGSCELSVLVSLFIFSSCDLLFWQYRYKFKLKSE
jgi:hypothetical protein